MSDILSQIKALSNVWHESGSVWDSVLDEFDRLGRQGKWQRTMETGCGRTTLLISQYSHRHTVFAYGIDDSAKKTFSSELLQKDRVELVPGPTQRTVPNYKFEEPFDLIMIDGPHGYPFPEIEYYYTYPHLKSGGTLVLDDIHIPSIHRMYEFLREDAMFHLDKVVRHTAFFTRTDAPTFDPEGDGWNDQVYNRIRYPLRQPLVGSIKTALKRRAKIVLHALGLRKNL